MGLHIVTNWSLGDIDHLLRQERRLVFVRWAGVALILIAAFLYTTTGVSLPSTWWVPIASFAACNLYLHGSIESVRRHPDPIRTMMLIVTMFDWVAIGFLGTTWLYDDFYGSWPTLIMMPLVGGLRFTMSGALGGWTIAAALYLVAGTSSDVLDRALVLDPDALVYRFGLLLLMALAIGAAAREQRQSRRHAEDTLEQLQRSEAWRARLVATLGHDVRGPIGNVVSAAQMLQLRGAEIPPSLLADTYDAIERQSSRALRLADDLLDMARMEHGGVRLDIEEVDLVQLAQRVVGADRDVAIDAEVEPLHAHVDPGRIEQVLHNLVVNARRHGKPPITIELARRDGYVEIGVVDHGPGLPEDASEQLFEAFEHGGAAASTGLGLWIVTTLVDAHGGSIDYRRAPMGGACFVVRLPVNPA
jgi:signal transduction histidine kinase